MPRILGKDPDTKDNVLYEDEQGNVLSLTQQEAAKFVRANRPNSNNPVARPNQNPASQLQPGNQPLNAPDESQDVFSEVNAETDEFAQGGALSNPNALAGPAQETQDEPTDFEKRGILSWFGQKGEVSAENPTGAAPEDEIKQQPLSQAEKTAQRARELGIKTVDEEGNPRSTENLEEDIERTTTRRAQTNEQAELNRQGQALVETNTGNTITVPYADKITAENNNLTFDDNGQLVSKGGAALEPTKVGETKSKKTFEQPISGPSEQTQQQLADAQQRVRDSILTEISGARDVEQFSTEVADKLIDRQEEDARLLAQSRQELAARKQQKLAAFDERMNELSQLEVDPNNIFQGNGGAVFGAALSVGVGQMLNTLYDIPNTAASLIDRAIERDIQAQKFNIQQKNAIFQKRLNLYDENVELWEDQELAEAQLRATMTEYAKKRFQNEMARKQIPINDARRQRTLAQFDQKIAAARAKAETVIAEVEVNSQMDKIRMQRRELPEDVRKQQQKNRERLETRQELVGDRYVTLTRDRDVGEQTVDKANSIKASGSEYIRSYNKLINMVRGSEGQLNLTGADKAAAIAAKDEILNLRALLAGAGALSDEEAPRLKAELNTIITDPGEDGALTLSVANKQKLLRVLRETRERDKRKMKTILGTVYAGNGADVILGEQADTPTPESN